MTKSFAAELEKRVKEGGMSTLCWHPWMENRDAKYEVDCMLAFWLTYLDVKGYKQTAKFWRFHARNESRADYGLTLPGVMPQSYDPSYKHPSQPLWTEHPSEVWERTSPGRYLDAEGRKAQVAEIRALMAAAGKNMTMFPDEPKGKHQQPEPPKAKTLAELKQEAVDNPVKMSPGLAAKLGLKKENDE